MRVMFMIFKEEQMVENKGKGQNQGLISLAFFHVPSVLLLASTALMKLQLKIFFLLLI